MLHTHIPAQAEPPCSLGGVKLPWQNSKQDDSTTAPDKASGSTSLSAKKAAEADSATAPSRGAKNDTQLSQAKSEERPLPKGYTPPKGRATPKRRDQEIARGVIRDPHALSPAEAAQRHKELKKSMSKEEWKEYKRKNREENRERNREIQERMQAGDERFLLERDKGEERRFVRDWVDSRRQLNNWVMPLMLVLLVVMLLGNFFPVLANILSLLALVFFLVFLIEGVMIGRGANQATRERFPETTKTGFGLGMYAYSRASQPRRWRSPKPQVPLGANV